ncbi:hypothetical protein SDC9_71932 [bioreactor metagenome]|uniref:DUF11 domain-containing protein n=1 Tax=bioreactor metagenome TaxID=1076179 RepID=A0A644YBV9_9ZZZZ|nr:hypothetical protein [Sedimentibacter saalensis]MEA5095589.1 hypothetical protein [Sedimentibacter saalensis]
MKECTISIDAPDKILKGAGIPDSSFVPSGIYNIKIKFSNTGENSKICSFSSTLGNGIRYLKNFSLEGPDESLKSKLIVVEPNALLGNNNCIIFANNFILSPGSTNVLSFNVALCDRYTTGSVENSGDKIPHKEKINFFAHLIEGENVDSCSASSSAHDYEMKVMCQEENIKPGETTKFYVHCCTGQYDVARSVYIRSILDDGLEFVADSCNLEPRNVYKFNGKTVIKWDVGTLQPSETRRIGYMVKLRSDLNKESGTMLRNKLNSNCINNSEYTQCPSSCSYSLRVINT